MLHYVFPGLGAGAGATLFGELARISTKKERTKVFSTFTMMRQVGLILGMYGCSCTHSIRYTVCCISYPVCMCVLNQFLFPSGPAFNLFLRVLNVKIGPFTLDKFTAPGVSVVSFIKKNLLI